MLIPPGTILLLTAMASQFAPPTRAQQLSAIGLTSGLPLSFQRALEPRDDFPSIPVPGPSDWLRNHSEAGQTFDQFTRSLTNRPDHHRSKLYLQPLGRFNESNAPSLDQLRRFGFDVVERYRRLLVFYRQEGLEDEAQWFEKRLQFIAPHDRS